MDAANRLKILHDCLAEVLEVDDSYFWEGSFRKLETTKAAPWAFVELYPTKPKSVEEYTNGEK